MAEPKAKSARPSNLQSRLPFISGNALSAVLKLMRDEALPDAISRPSLVRVRDQDTRIDTPYGLIHQQIDLPNVSGDKPHTIEIQHPLAILYHTAKESASFADVLRPLIASASPSNPLRICMYTDEVLPGNALAVKTERKVWAFYWTILELGSSALSDEDVFAS